MFTSSSSSSSPSWLQGLRPHVSLFLAGWYFIIALGSLDLSLLWTGKVKWSRYRPGVAQRVGRGKAVLFHDLNTRKGWVVSSTPLPHFTPRKTRYPFYRRLGGSQGRSGRAENLVPTGIWSWTVQPVVSRYTDWTTRPPSVNRLTSNMIQSFLGRISRIFPSPQLPNRLWVPHSLSVNS